MQLSDDQLGGLFVFLWLAIVSGGCALCFNKAGRPVWPALVPLLNLVHLCRLGGTTPWLVVGLLIPFVNLLVPLYIAIRLAKQFGWHEMMGIVVWLSGFTLLPILTLRKYIDPQWVEAQIVSNSGEPVDAIVQTSNVSLTAMTFSRIRMIVLTVGYVMGLVCLPGLMVVGAMAFGGATADQVQRAQMIVGLFALTPLSLLGALIGGWILHVKHRYWTATSLVALPVFNAFAVIGSFVWVMSR